MLQPLYPQGKKPLIPFNYEAGWTPELVWIFWRREKSLAPTALKSRFISHPVHSLVTMHFPMRNF